MKWEVKIREGLLIEEWFIKADGSLSNLNHFEFTAKNGGDNNKRNRLFITFHKLYKI